MRRPNFSQRGFTLVELVFVIAIIVVLASIFLPLAVSKLRKADEAATDASIQEIAAALASFYDDLRHFPACGEGPQAETTDCSPLGSGNNDLVFLAFGDGSGDLGAFYPDAATGSGNWDFQVNESTDPDENNGNNHLVVNDPNGDQTLASAADYVSSGSKRWRGPYLARVSLDAWGRTFIAYVGAMEASGAFVSGATSGKGWILSAGPNNSLSTTPTSTSLDDDDRGFIFHTE